MTVDAPTPVLPDPGRAAILLPPERPYPLPVEIARLIGAGGEENP